MYVYSLAVHSIVHLVSSSTTISLLSSSSTLIVTAETTTSFHSRTCVNFSCVAHLTLFGILGPTDYQ